MPNGYKGPQIDAGYNPPSVSQRLNDGSSGSGQPGVGDVIAEMLGLLGSNGDPGTPGTYVPGSAPQLVSQAGARASAIDLYNQRVDDTSNVFDQAVGLVRRRNPRIRQSYRKSARRIGDRTENAVDAGNERQQDRNRQYLRQADELGLTVAPDARTDASKTVKQNRNMLVRDSNRWQNALEGQKLRAVERNRGVADAFRYSEADAIAQLGEQLQQTLAGLADYYVGGSSGGYVGGTAPSGPIDPTNKLWGYKSILEYMGSDAWADIAASQQGIGGGTAAGGGAPSSSYQDLYKQYVSGGGGA